MAIYGYDFYGRSRYGSTIHIDFGVEPFTATAVSHEQIEVTWNEPTGEWTNFRLLVNRAGYSINEDDGIILLNISEGRTPEKFSDDVRNSGWYYYTIFILNDQLDTWERAGIASALAMTNYGMGDVLWGLLPEYYRTVRDNTAGYSAVNYAIGPSIYLTQDKTADNDHLKKYLNVFGWGFDILRSQIDTILWGYNPDKLNVDRLALLSNQFGAEIERSVPAQTSRNLIRNLGLLYRKRGTPEGIREMLALATGWQVEVTLGPNFMLSEDQANFINPVIPDWDKTVRYVVDDQVRYNSHTFTALQTAYGPAQSPPNDGDNAYWEFNAIIEENVALRRPDTLNIGTWQAIALNADEPLNTITSTHIGRGVADPVNPDLSVNALGVKNTTDDTDDILVRCVPYYGEETEFDRELTQASAIPVPTAVVDWSADVDYDAGDMVNFAGIVYQAYRPTRRYPVTTDWKMLGYDRRVRIALSFYTHGRFSGGGPTSNLVTPYLAAFDDQGDLLYDVLLTPDQVVNVNFDSMNKPFPFVPNRELDLGGKEWTYLRGLWGQNWEFDDTGFIFPVATDQTYAFFDSTMKDCNIGVTFRTAGERQMGILFRCSDSGFIVGTPGYAVSEIHNGLVASQTRLIKIVSGFALGTLATYDPFEDGDRMVVGLDGDEITIKKNGNTVVVVNDDFNKNATKHGLVAL